ncbi:glycosyltransferase family 2 protein [Nocardioides mangrovicus]|uniref:Glycosyltransferase family 2 protein n=1 Tax=Nocardioides mangrovicus TaxID=2478913 RepID=A0A3L8P568_9ACTN|nr:glycosyltransferase [Nocardioides mangrovicus]RLV49913.1 glycosyltransferase family 2 protein [Nocardioides mangrovicus]
MSRRVLQRQIMPADKDVDVLPLYVDPDPISLDADKYTIGGNRGAKDLNNSQIRQKTSSGETIHPDQITGRHGVRVEAREQLSLGTYFNGFPAGYWRRWTIVEQVRLTVTLQGAGGSVVVYRSMANGRSQRVDTATSAGSEPTDFVFDLTLVPFVDGGWYWYDVVAADEPVEVTAVWDTEVPEDRVTPGSLAVAITTMNRPEMCADLLAQLGSEEETFALLDEVFVADQGTKKVRDADRFAAAEEALGGRLRVVDQGNIGGSGGYARGQSEAVQRGSATYVMCMDDDVVCEPQSIVRAVTFADLAKRPTIVGGHMFSIYDRARLHSYGEIVQRYKFWWRSPVTVYNDWDFAARNLRSARWLHRRIDVDFNGWFMCVIPRETLERVGLSLPIFIKWDDSEFGLRAAEAGYPTVSFPGAAVWHIPWSDKNDALDWQAYFHHRNRLIAALLHSPYPRGGGFVQESFAHTVKHLVAMQYSTVELRHLALEDVFAGPSLLHEELPTKLADINAFRKQWADAVLEPARDAFPPVRRTKPPKRGKDDTEIPTKPALALNAVVNTLRQLSPARPLSREYPETEIPAVDGKWYHLAKYDSAVVSMPDGTSAAFYQRDPEHFRDLLRRTVEIHRRLAREWPELSRQYRDSLAEITSPEVWEKTFMRSTQSDPTKGAR